MITKAFPSAVSQPTSSVPLTFYNQLIYCADIRPASCRRFQWLHHDIDLSRFSCCIFQSQLSNTTTCVSLGSKCTVQVTAFKTDGSTYEDVAGGTNIAKLSFQIVTSEILREVDPSLGGLLKGAIGMVGSIMFIIDKFNANYNCVAGKTNSVVAPGLCRW
ncbi:hypothetical protein EAE99_007757 [Botrytis elliptica]|nr:hypothetical protein EAE99_007757 [Botrytis elliptica]